jgi:hypothetical protein
MRKSVQDLWWDDLEAAQRRTKSLTTTLLPECDQNGGRTVLY